MAAVAALVGAACFILGRQAARAAAAATLNDGRDVEVIIWHRLAVSSRDGVRGNISNLCTSMSHRGAACPESSLLGIDDVVL